MFMSRTSMIVLLFYDAVKNYATLFVFLLFAATVALG